MSDSEETNVDSVPDIPVVTEAAEEVEEVTEPRPDWVDEIIEAVSAVPEKIEDTSPDPVTPEAPAEVPPGDSAPGTDDDNERDEAPSGKPWTHVNPFKRNRD